MLLPVAVLTRLRDEVEVEVVPVERTLPLRDEVVVPRPDTTLLREEVVEPEVTALLPLYVADPLRTELVVRCVVFCAAALEPPREDCP